MTTFPRRAAGFTLIELMVTIAIATMLIAIGGPAYQTQVRKARRVDAKTAILDMAGREERLFSTTNTYSADPAALGYTGPFPVVIGGQYYNLTVSAPVPAAGAPPTYLVTATAINSQVKDIQCTSFTVDQTGQLKTLDNNSVDTSTTCLN
jgi:type IV pilus assembly protein PilE